MTKSLMHHPGLFIATSGEKGNGVFTATEINKGDLIEICPVIVIPSTQRGLIHNTILHDYYFLWGEANESCAIALGYGSIYNHSSTPNAQFVKDHEAEKIIIECIEDIRAGEEITFQYIEDGVTGYKLWFEEK